MPSLSPDGHFSRRIASAGDEEHPEVPALSSELASWLAAAPAGSSVTVLFISPPAVAPANAPARADEDPVKKWYSTKEIAAIHGVRPATVQRWVRDHRFPGVRRLPNGAIRIPKATADEVLFAADGSSTIKETLDSPDFAAQPAASQKSGPKATATTPLRETKEPTFDGWRKRPRGST